MRNIIDLYAIDSLRLVPQGGIMKRISVPFFFVFNMFCFIEIIGNDFQGITRSRVTQSNLSDIYSLLHWKAFLALAYGNQKEAQNIINAIQNHESIFIAVRDPIEEFFDALFIDGIAHNPQYITQFGLFEKLGMRDHNAYLNEIRVESVSQSLEKTKCRFQELQAFDRNSLSDAHKVSYDVVRWSLEHELEGEKFLFHDYVVNQMFGLLSNLTALFTTHHSLSDSRDVAHYCKRLSAIPDYLDQIKIYLKYQHDHGIHIPHFALEKVIQSIRDMLVPDVTKHILYVRLANAVAHMSNIEGVSVLKRVHTIIENQVYPAYESLADFCERLSQDSAGNQGVWALPNGDTYYAYMLTHHTTTKMTPDEIHELGLSCVSSCEHEIRMILEKEGIKDDTQSLGQLLQRIIHDPRFYFEDNEQGRVECLQAFEQILKESRTVLSHLFDMQPKQPVVVKPVPIHEQMGRPAAYYDRPSLDGSRPGTFYINLRDMHEVPRYRMKTLAVHEAEPGHHFQLVLQQTMSLPLVRRMASYTAYVEGWALYVEKLAHEYGFYNDSWSYLGHLLDDMLRAVRLVVDTGIHYKRWTREQAIDYMIQMTGSHRNTVTTEVERYFVYPGQACSYKIGQLKILALRDRMKKAMGKSFDIRMFHNLVLSTGAVPLSVLEHAVDEYIAHH